MVDGLMKLAVDPARAAEVNRKLVSAGLDVSELKAHEGSLEEAFLRLTGGEGA